MASAGLHSITPFDHIESTSEAYSSLPRRSPSTPGARAGRCGVVRDFVGHGIGRKMHEEPPVPNFGRPGRGPILEPGMTICIEPMLTRGTHKVDVLEDGWTVVTHDGLPAAHFEHTVLITESGAEVLTPRED